MLRIATEADVPAMLAIYAPYILTTTYTFEYDVPTCDEFLQRFRAVTAQFPWLVWEENGEILGYAYGSAPFERAAYRWMAEDSLYLRPDAQGRGIGTRLCAALEKLLALQGYRRIYAIVTDENTPSIRFHEKNGYRVCAHFPDCGFKFGRRLGVTWLDKEPESVEISSNFPASWQSLMQDSQKISDILGILSLS